MRGRCRKLWFWGDFQVAAIGQVLRMGLLGYCQQDLQEPTHHYVQHGPDEVCMTHVYNVMHVQLSAHQ